MFRFIRIDRVEVNGAAARDVQPIRAAVVPDEISRQRADGIEVALEIGVGIFPRAVVQTFFAGLAGRADSEHARLNGFECLQAVVAADFEEPRVALAVVEVPFERGGHGDDPGGAQHARFFRERIRKPRGRDALGAEQRVALFRDMGNRQNLAVTEADEPLAQARFGFELRESRRTLPSRGQTRRKFVEAVNARNFLDEIDFARDFGAPGRLRAFPSREERARRAAVLVDSNGRKTKRAESGFNFLVGHVGAHHAKDFRARHADFFWRTLARKNVNDTG